MGLLISQVRQGVWSGAPDSVLYSKALGWSGLQIGFLVSLVVHAGLFSTLCLAGFFYSPKGIRSPVSPELAVQMYLEPSPAIAEEQEPTKPTPRKSLSVQFPEVPVRQPASSEPPQSEPVSLPKVAPPLPRTQPPPVSAAVVPAPPVEQPEPTLVAAIPGATTAQAPLVESGTPFAEATSGATGGVGEKNDFDTVAGDPQGVEAGYLVAPRPAYPKEALRRRQKGTVILGVSLTAEGFPSRVDVKQSSGYSILDEAALEAVLRWKFVPARLGQTRVSSQVEVPVQFKLSQAQARLPR